MEKWEIFKNKLEGRSSSPTYVRILEVFKPWTYQHNWEKDKRSELKLVRGIFIKYERCQNKTFDYCYTNYMKRADFKRNFSIKIEGKWVT